jgi:cytoskeletal protein CcmA (bactofilin family)
MSRTPHSIRPPSRGRSLHRRGGIYLAVLGVAMLVSVIGLAALATARAQRVEANAVLDATKARSLSQSAVELGVLMVLNDASWRANRSNGVWVAAMPVGDGTMKIEGLDPLDSNLSNRTNDPLVIRGTGLRGTAVQSTEVTLTATGDPLDALKFALHSAGQLHVNPGQNFTALGAPASTNGSLRNDGTITGDVECRAFTQMGTISGSFNPAAPIKAMPDAGLLNMYKALGTTIAPGSAINKAAIGPGYTPWGPTNPEGVYLINLSGNLTISNTRLVGTLVIIGNGKSITINSSCNLQPYRQDYPVIITDGDLTINLSNALLSEAANTTNFNPPGVPWNPSGLQSQGTTNANSTDVYPSEIRGLVHTRSKVSIGQTTYIKGLVIAESAAATDAASITSNITIDYDPALFTNPPMGYTKSVTMSILPGSWKQVVYP